MNKYKPMYDLALKETKRRADNGEALRPADMGLLYAEQLEKTLDSAVLYIVECHPIHDLGLTQIKAWRSFIRQTKILHGKELNEQGKQATPTGQRQV